MKNVFVFRISKGNQGGYPNGSCSLDYSNILRRIPDIKESELKIIDYDSKEVKDFIKNEFWENKTLRQGWGFEELDLNQDTKSWIENYMLGCKLFWNDEITCSKAKGRWNILNRMRMIKIDDYLIIPKTSKENIDDYNSFIVCQAASEYYFQLKANIKDYGHCINIKEIREFKFGKNSLFRSDFSSPYLWAITQVLPHHYRYTKFINFINRQYHDNK